MKRILPLFLLLAMSGLAHGQNQAPVVMIDNAIYYSVFFNTLVVNYSLQDAEQDTCTVVAMISTDGGITYGPVLAASVSGDRGTGISPGSQKFMAFDGPAIFFDSLTRIKLIAYDNSTPEIDQWLSQIDTARLRNDLNFVAKPRNHTSSLPHLQAVRDSLHALFEANQLTTTIQAVPYGGYSGSNVIATKSGLLADSATVIIDGHYDSVPFSPGANDNGIATVALMEAARVLNQGHFERSISLIAFDLEEYGLLGSKRYVQSLASTNTEVLGVLNMEMIGYFTEKPNTQQLPTGFNVLFPTVYQAVVADSFRGNFLANVGNTASSMLQTTFDSLSAVHAPGLVVYGMALPGTGTIAPDFRRSDHAPFWDAAIPALMLTAGADFRDSSYHSTADSLSRISFDKVAEVISGILATAIHLAGPLNASTHEVAVVVDTGGDAIAQLLPQDLVSLFPNPGTDLLSLRSEIELEMVRVLDVQGRVVARSKGKEIRLDAKTWPSGTYVIFAQTRKGVWISRWIKE